MTLTTIEHRQDLEAFRRMLLQAYLEGGSFDWTLSDEQLALLMAALAALATEPLVPVPACVEPLLDDLLEANRRFGFD